MATQTTHLSSLPPVAGRNSLSLVEVKIDELVLPKAALRRHPKAQIEKLKESILHFGWVSPILIDKDRNVIAGQARIAAAKALGLVSAPAVRADHLSEAEVRAYRIADNKLAEAAEWDEELLAIELREIEVLGIDLELTGFETPEIDILFTTEAEDTATEDRFDPPAEDGVAVAQIGDLWRLGDHLLLCGNALHAESYDRLLGGDLVDMVFTDPPYNVPVKGHMGGLGSVQHREFVMASGEMSPEAFKEFLLTTMVRAKTHARDGGVIFTCIDWRSVAPLFEVTDKAGLEPINLCVWNKTNGGMGSLYRSKHELVLVARVPGQGQTNNVELGRHGRNRTNVWDYPGANTLGQGSDLNLHPTVKPVALVADAIQDVTKRGETVLDMFGGSGSTLIAAERVGRRAQLIELDPLYVDTIIRRFEAEFDVRAELVGSGQVFGEVEERRADQSIAPSTKTRVRRRPSELEG
ncbi:MAG: DNA methyltransferase [Pseudomonadota bacterium]